jgi:hypothetical protein
MSETNWILERPKVDHEEFGLPVSENGIFLSRAEILPRMVQKAGEVLDTLFELQELHDFEICEDSEHTKVFVDLKNGFTVAYENSDHHKAELLSSTGFLAGYLTKT